LQQHSLLFARRRSASGAKSKKVAVLVPANKFTNNHQALHGTKNAFAKLDFFASFCVKAKRRDKNHQAYKLPWV